MTKGITFTMPNKEGIIYLLPEPGSDHLTIKGIQINHSLARAFQVLSLIRFTPEQLKFIGTVEVCSNCREQLLVLNNWSSNNQVSWSEDRGSDQTVVYWGQKDEFDFASNMASEEVYRRARRFNRNQLQEAANFIQDVLAVDGVFKLERK